MSHSPISPSLAQFEQIISYLQMLPRKIRHRGSALAKGGAVRRLWWQSVNRVLMAKVQGTGLHTQSMRFSESGVSVANCTCPYGEDCKHAAAALITFCAGWVGPGPDLKSDDDDYSGEADAEDEDEDEDEGRTGRSANPSAAPTRPGRLPAKPASKPARSTPDPTTLAYALSARFGRKLTAAEQKQTTLIDQLYRNGGTLFNI